MSLLLGKLQLFPQANVPGAHSIDFFFRSLADDLKEHSIGVVLSGMGSDGTLGLRAIKERAGATFVQGLASAKFDGMPRGAIDAGVADVVAPVEELPERIRGYLQHAPHIKRPALELQDKALSALDKVFVLLRSHTGSDFSLYKKSTIYRRIERRMGLHQIDNIRRLLSRSRLLATSRCRFLLPIWIGTPSIARALACIRTTSQPTSRRSGSGASSYTRSVASAWARRSGRWWCLRHKTSSWIHPSRSWTSSAAATCSSICPRSCRRG